MNRARRTRELRLSLHLLGAALASVVACDQTQLLEGPADPVSLDGGGLDATSADVVNDVASDVVNDVVHETSNDATDSSDAGPLLPQPLASDAGSVLAIAVDDTHVYWAGYDSRSVVAVPKQGGDAVPVSTSEPARVIGLTVDTSRVYWTIGDADSNGAIRSAPRAGIAGAPVTLVPDAGSPWFITHDDAHLYWTDLNGIVLTSGTDGGASRTLATGGDFALAIALSADMVYWTEHQTGTIKRVSKDGGPSVPVAQGPGPQSIPAFALDGERIYWLENSTVGSRVRSAPLAGGDPVDVTSFSQTGWGIAIDATDVYFTVLAGGGVARVPKAGGNAALIAAVLQQGNLTSGAIALDDSYVYWSSGDGAIFRMRKR